MNKRQQTQHAFDQGGQELVVGKRENCPVPPEELAAITPNSPNVVKVINSGLTAEIFHLKFGDNEYTLKRKRRTAKVDNLDGQYSFLNEVQRRDDFEKFKAVPELKARFSHIVDTIYADYRLGIILSPWIEGRHIHDLTPNLIKQLFFTLQACEEQGLMEWDLCAGNLLVDENEKLWLFDFGYMYSFDPLKEWNSNGLNDPLFHAAERVETRFFFGWLLEKKVPFKEQLNIYRSLKEGCTESYQHKLDWLKQNGAIPEVIAHFESLLTRWLHALEDEQRFQQLFKREAFRSHILDIEDDLHGKTCTSLTLTRISYVLEALTYHFDDISENGGLFYGNKGKSQATLLCDYQKKYQLAMRYQL